MGFVASEKVDSLDYNLNVKGQDDPTLIGTIPEPSTQQIETYRDALIAAFKVLGIEPGEDKKFSLDDLDEMISKSDAVEKDMIVATSNLTGISARTLEALPYRISRAFVGWIMGEFFSPEASTPATKQ